MPEILYFLNDGYKVISFCLALGPYTTLNTTCDITSLFSQCLNIFCDSITLYLPPANEVLEGYVFTGVCLSVHRGVPTPLHAGIHPLGRHPPSGQTPLRQTPPTPSSGQTHPPRAVHTGIRSTSGQYASHWNVFLFVLSMLLEKQKNELLFEGS